MLKNLIKKLYNKYFPELEDKEQAIKRAYLNGVQREFVELEKFNVQQEKKLVSDTRDLIENPAFSLIMNNLLLKELEIISYNSKSLIENKDAVLMMRAILYVESAFRGWAESIVEQPDDDE
jgi:hypothetical protein